MRPELHILIGCADARDFSQIQREAILEKTEEFRLKDVDINLEILRVAGSFVTPDVVSDVKRAIETFQREHITDTSDVSYYIHIQTHGELDANSNKSYCSHVHEMNIVQGSPLNCGMMYATAVAIEIEKILLEEQPLIKSLTGEFRIEKDSDIVRMLKEVYGYSGYLAGDWLKSIATLRTHPREQKSILNRAINADPDLSKLGIKITMGIMDYSIHGLIRIDDGLPEAAFWDEVQLLTREKAQDKTTFLRLQSEKQQPLAGLISMSDPKRASRYTAANYYYTVNGINTQGSYLPNTIFNISGGSFDLPHSTFGPYQIGGFFYAVKDLELKDWMVMGYDQKQTDRILAKILHDPIMNMIVKRYNVNLIPLNQEEMEVSVAQEE